MVLDDTNVWCGIIIILQIAVEPNEIKDQEESTKFGAQWNGNTEEWVPRLGEHDCPGKTTCRCTGVISVQHKERKR